MENDNNILEELKKISQSLMRLKKTEVYSVPPYYFNNLPDEIIELVSSEYKERAYFPKSSTPYGVPTGYFGDLTGIITQKISSPREVPNAIFEELDSIAPLLNTISKKPLYTAPINYFDNIQLPFEDIKKQKVKVVSIKKRSRRIRYAAAAIIIPFLAIGLYTITGREFMNVRNGNSSAKNKVKNLSKEEIVDYLKKSTIIENASSTSKNTSVNDAQIKSSLKQISDKEIQQFLKETGEADEI